jgi:hypothetical protein
VKTIAECATRSEKARPFGRSMEKYSSTPSR